MIRALRFEARGRLLKCRFGGHDFAFVEFKERRQPWGKSGWNHECRRCRTTAYFTSAPSRRLAQEPPA